MEQKFPNFEQLQLSEPSDVLDEITTNINRPTILVISGSLGIDLVP